MQVGDYTNNGEVPPYTNLENMCLAFRLSSCVVVSSESIYERSYFLLHVLKPLFVLFFWFLNTFGVEIFLSLQFWNRLFSNDTSENTRS